MVIIENNVVIKISFDASLKSDLYREAIIAEFAAAGIAVITTGMISVIPVTPITLSITKTRSGNTTNR